MPKGIRPEAHLSIRNNSNQFATVIVFGIAGGVESLYSGRIVEDVATPFCDRTVDFDGIDATLAVFMTNVRIVSRANRIDRSIAPVDLDFPLAALDGEEQLFTIIDLPPRYEQFVGV